MALFVMLGLWFSAVELPFLLLPTIAAGAMIKHFAAVILPFAFLYVARRCGLLRALASAAAAAALFIACSLPFLSDRTPLPRKIFVEVLFTPQWSLASSVYWIVVGAKKLFFPSTVYQWATEAPPVVFLLAGGILLTVAIMHFAANRRPTIQELAAVSVLAEGILILVALSDFLPWHLVAILPTSLVLVPEHWLRRLTIALSITWLLCFTPLSYHRILGVLIMTLVPMVWVCYEQLGRRQV